MIKNLRDFILGLVMLALSLYLMLSPKIVKGMTLLYTSITVAKADTYIRLLGGLLLLLSAVLILRALGLFGLKAKKTDEKKPVDWLVIAGFATLLIYMPLMKIIGFTASSILLTASFKFMIRFREKKADLHNWQELLKNLGVSIAYAVVLVSALELLFTRALHVRLP